MKSATFAIGFGWTSNILITGPSGWTSKSSYAPFLWSSLAPVRASAQAPAADIDPGMDVGRAAEVPEHGGAFDLLDVPYPVVPDVFVLVESHVEVIEPAGFDQLHGFVGVCLAERRQEIGHHLAHVVLLIAGQFC